MSVTTENKIDFETKLFMFLFNLKEDKKKQYSFSECKSNIVYIFKNYAEFESYFTKNGMNYINAEILELCKMKTTKNGNIIALKNLCDHTIKQYKTNKILTNKEIDRIHEKGKITPLEKVEEWERMGLCAPADAERCHTFSNCSDCLREYANSQDEYDKFELELKLVCKD